MTTRFRLLTLVSLTAALLTAPLAARPASTAGPLPHRVQVMILGVAHFVSKHDVHNSTLSDILGPEHQKQIQAVLDSLAKFKPTKVMIEKPYGDAQYLDQYHQYLKGSYTLGANEIYQLGFRLAAMSQDPDIYPIDTPDDDSFPFDYPGMVDSAKHYKQGYLDAAEAHWKPYLAREDELEEHGSILDLLRYLNTPEAIEYNASWYAYADRIGADKDYKGADVVSNWYARNLHMFANIMRGIDSPDDRVVVIVGQGHAYLLKECVRLSPDLELVDPGSYLR